MVHHNRDASRTNFRSKKSPSQRLELTLFTETVKELLRVIKPTHEEQKEQMCSMRQDISAMYKSITEAVKSVASNNDGPPQKKRKNSEELEAIVYNMHS